MSNYFDSGNVFIEEDSKNFKGINYNLINLHLHKKFFQTHIITEREEYRPDIIADFILFDSAMSWVLDEINSADSISFYTKGRKISYLPSAYLRKIGVA